MVYEYDYDEETQKMRINCLGGLYGDSIEDYSACMATTIDKLMELKKVVRIVFAGVREYEYDFSESKMLLEIALAIERMMKDRLISLKNVVIAGCENDSQERYRFLQRLLNDLRFDPIDAYRNLTREIRKVKTKIERETGIKRDCYSHYLSNSLIPIAAVLDNCRLIQLAKPNITEHKDRSLYRRIFHPTIRPNFIYTRYISLPPANAELLERYMVGETEIEIYNIPGQVRRLYHIIPPEFRLNEIEYNLLDTARRYLGHHEPRESDLEEPERIRENLFRIGLDMIRDLAADHDIPEKRLEELANILARYTAGLGILDLMLQDENIQDIEINSPIGASPVFLFHGIYQECETNIVPSREDGESWATRFRLKSGRPLDEANPVLDTEIEVPGGRARVAAITRTLSPDGLGFAFRRHRDKPWTLPLFINNRMIDPFSAGLLWFLIDGSRTMLIAGTRSSGKSSLLGALMVQIMPKLRIISVEDSVTGDCQIVYERNGKIEKGTVGGLIDGTIERHGCDYDFGREILRKNPENIRVFSMDKNGKFKLSSVRSFIRHKTTKDIYEIITRTGKKIKVTGDHSLFTLGKDGKIIPAKVRKLEIDDYLATPRTLPFETSEKKSIDILEYVQSIEKGFFTGSGIKKCINDNWECIKKKEENRSQRCRWRRLGILPARFVKEFAKNVYKFDQDIFYKSGATAIPRFIPLTNEFMEFLGLWLADGCYDKKSVIISVVDEQSRACVRSVAERFGANVKMHSDGISLMVNSSSLRQIMRALGFAGNAYTKNIPSWIYELDKGKVAAILRGLFSGDGHASKSEVTITLCSKELIKDIQTLLLSFGIISRVGSFRESDKTYPCRISALSSLQDFRKIGFLQDEKKARLETLCNKKSTHDSSDVIPLSLETKNVISDNHDGFSYYDYIKRDNNIGRQKLSLISSRIKNSEIASNMEILAKSDIFWDQIREIRRLESMEEFVYDFSVPENENFVCENILAHNTLELPTNQLRELGYNIQSMKSRSVITNVDTELPAEEALRTALRLGDSCLIIGEVRSREALALYEAMRIGALANLVAGTIHGDSAYGVFDRVVNDLGVPPTSFKATDIILIANMLKSPDGLRSFRRCVELTEVRKHWKTDPAEEGGFVNLLDYSAKDDILKPSKTLLMGESAILNDIAQRVREWKGNWDAVWNNIKLRGKIMQTIVDYANVNNRPDLLEANSIMASNSHFHIISSEVKEELGALDSTLIYDRWLQWLRKNY